MHRHQVLSCALVLLASAASQANAVDIPKRKSGLWEMTMTTESKNSPNSKPMVMQTCIDEKTDDLTRQQGESMTKEMCSKSDISTQGNSLVVDSVCKFGESKVSSHAVMTGDYKSGYTMTSQSTYSPPMMGMSESTTTIAAKWIGPCLPGQKPGDVIMKGMPNMPKMNLNELQKLKK